MSDPRPARGRKDRGAVLVITAMALPVLILMTAFSIDLGRQRAARRDMQAKADVIALDLARLIDGSTYQNIDYAAPLAASAQRNNVPVAKITSVTWGTLNATTHAFEACATANCVPSAVKVRAEDSISYFFQRGMGDVSRSAVAAQDSVAAASIGSFAAAVDLTKSGIAQAPVLNALIGDALNLGLLGYSGLANWNLSFAQIASSAGLGTPTELFSGDVSAFEALTAAAAVMQQQNPNAAELAVLNQVLAVPNSPLHDVSVADIANVQAGSEDAALASTVNLFDFLTAAAFIANGSSALTLPTTTLGAGLFTSTAHVTQGPQFWSGGVGAQSPLTSQVGLDGELLVSTGTICESTTNLLAALPLVGNLLSLLTGAGGCGFLNLNKIITVEVRAVVSANLAAAKGTFTNIACPAAGKQLDVAVRSDLVSDTSVALHVLLKAGTNTIADIPLNAATNGGQANGSVPFTVPPDVFGVYKASNPSSGSLGLDNLSLTAGGLGPLEGPVEALVNPVITTALDAINLTLIEPLSEALGVRVASADVAAHNILCNSVKLTG